MLFGAPIVVVVQDFVLEALAFDVELSQQLIKPLWRVPLRQDIKQQPTQPKQIRARGRVFIKDACVRSSGRMRALLLALFT